MVGGVAYVTDVDGHVQGAHDGDACEHCDGVRLPRLPNLSEDLDRDISKGLRPSILGGRRKLT